MTNTMLNGGEASEVWVDDVGRRVHRNIFTDSDVHSLEIARIFNRSWLFLGHETEIPNRGDYVTRPMGGDQIIVVRGEDQKIRGFLNACRHKGAQICRADSGHARFFVCPYHAWTYDNKGALRSTSYDQHYSETDFARLGLTPVPKLALYCGLIFGTWNEDAVSLDDHLGDTKWYLDILFGRTPRGMSVLSPPQRWIVETNWKIPAINFLDSQHALRTHQGPLTIGQAAGAPSLASIAKIADVTPVVSFPEGHGVVIGPYFPELPEFFGHPPELADSYKQTLKPKQLAQFREAPPAVGTIFPNTSWVESLLAVGADSPPNKFLSLRNWQPLGPNKIEIWSWYFAEVEASQEWRTKMHRTALQTFGMGGIFEEDDSEVWASISRAIHGPMASKEYMDFGAGRSLPPLENFMGPGTAYPSQLVDHAQFGFFRRWNQLMQIIQPIAEAKR